MMHRDQGKKRRIAWKSNHWEGGKDHTPGEKEWKEIPLDVETRAVSAAKGAPGKI